MATIGINTNTQLDLFELLQDSALEACSNLAKICDGGEPIHRELRQKFLAAVADIETVTIEALATTAGAFVIKDGHLKVAEAPVSRLLTVIVSDIETRIDQDKPAIDGEEIPKLLERVFIQYVLHELRHRTQGLCEYSEVQMLKNLAGPAAIAEYDTFADRDAAMAVAVMYAEDGSRAAFLRSFREALLFSTDYFFQTFPIPADRPDKIARVMSILFMAARLAKRDLSGKLVEDGARPLDAALFVSLSTPKKQLAIHRGEPSRELLGVANDEDGVGQLMEQICDGDFESALETSIRIIKRLDLG